MAAGLSSSGSDGGGCVRPGASLQSRLLPAPSLASLPTPSGPGEPPQQLLVSAGINAGQCTVTQNM